MRAFGNYVLLGYFQAVAVISLLAVFSLLVPPVLLLSAIVTGLVVLKKGPTVSMQVLLLCLLVVVLLVTLIGINPWIGFYFIGCILFPVYCCCGILWWTNDQGRVVLVAGIIGVAYILLIYTLQIDVDMFWLESMEFLRVQALSNSNFSFRDEELYEYVFSQQAPIALNAVIAICIVNSLVTITFISRWWHALLFNEGGFRKEFYQLRLPRVTMVLFLVVGACALYGQLQYEGVSIALEIFLVMMILYLFQGLASVHRIVAIKKMHSIWLMAMYFWLFILPQMFLVLVCLGLADAYANQSKSTVP